MDLIEYKQQSTRLMEVPFMSVSENGIIRFSKYAMDEIGLHDGDRITFYQDKKNPMDWYFKKTEEGARLRLDTSRNSICINFSMVAKKILQSIGTDKITRIRIATEPVDGGYYAIITRSVIENKK